MEINDFIATLAVLGGKDRTLTLQLIFRVYDINGSGIIERTKIERLLQMAYGDRLKEKDKSVVGSGIGPGSGSGSDITRAQQQLDDIFNLNYKERDSRKQLNNGNNSNSNSNRIDNDYNQKLNSNSNSSSSPKNLQNSNLNSNIISNTNSNQNSNKNESNSTLNLKNFEQYQGPLDVLGGWILAVLSAFTEKLPKKMLSLDQKYTKIYKNEDIMLKYKLTKNVANQLRETFLNRCSLTSHKPELTLDSFLSWTEGFLSPSLATLIFNSKVGMIKSVWYLENFVEFCVTFGSGSIEEKATAVTYAAYSRYYNDYRTRKYGSEKSFSVFEIGAEENFFEMLKKSEENSDENENDDKKNNEMIQINNRNSSNNTVSSSGSGSRKYDDDNNNNNIRNNNYSSNSDENNTDGTDFSENEHESYNNSNNSNDSNSEKNSEMRLLLNELKALVECSLTHSHDHVQTHPNSIFDRTYSTSSLLPLPFRSLSSDSQSNTNSKFNSKSNSNSNLDLNLDIESKNGENNRKFQDQGNGNNYNDDRIKTSDLFKNLDPRSIEKMKLSRNNSIDSEIENEKSNEKLNVNILKNENKDVFVPPAVRTAISRLEKKFVENSNKKESFSDDLYLEMGGLLNGIIQLIIEKNLIYFQGIKDLSITSCCLFGIKPILPYREKEYIMELMLRRQVLYPQNKIYPLGPKGTEWCIIQKEWWDSWRKYVGGQGGPVRSIGATAASSPRSSQVILMKNIFSTFFTS